jgi:hypothetical protein
MKLTTKSLVLSTATFGLMLGVAQNAQASLITGVTATVTGTTSNWDLDNAINGSGLTGNKPSLGGIHALSSSTNAWRSNNTTLPLVDPISITFKLGTVPTDLIGFSFWNMTGPVQNTANGVQGANLEYSTDGTNFSSLWTGSFLKGGTTASGPEVVNFSLVKATHVRLNMTSNYGGQRMGFNEISFKSIPEPSASLALLGLGLAGVGLRKRV